MHKYNIAK